MIGVEHHTLTINERDEPNEKLIARAALKPSSETTAEVCEELYEKNDKSTHPKLGANERNESQPHESNVRNDEGTETPKADRNSAHQIRITNDSDAKDEDSRHGPEETEIIENDVNGDKDDTREYVVEGIVSETERSRRKHYIVRWYGKTLKKTRWSHWTTFQIALAPDTGCASANS